MFGRESAGVPQNVHNNSYERLKIPIKKNARSLNLPSAVSVALSESIRQHAINQK